MARHSPEYLVTVNSPRWVFGIRPMMINTAHGLCELCDNRATQVHHSTGYRNLGHEQPWELAALCDDCHAMVHKENRNWAEFRRWARANGYEWDPRGPVPYDYLFRWWIVVREDDEPGAFRIFNLITLRWFKQNAAGSRGVALAVPEGWGYRAKLYTVEKTTPRPDIAARIAWYWPDDYPEASEMPREYPEAA